MPPEDVTARAPGWPARLFVATVTVYTLLENFLPAWCSDERFTSDFSQHVWWTWRYADAGLFPNDFIADFFSLPVFSPLGYRAWMRVAVPWLGAQSAAEALVLPVGLALGALGWRLGRACTGGSWVGAVVGGCIGARLIGGLDGGLPRDFGLAVVALGMVGLVEKRLWVVGLAGLLATLLYPPVVVNLGLTTVVVLGIDLVRERRLPAGWPALAALGAVALAVLLSAYATPLPDDVGPKLTGAEARAMAEFGPDGRSSMFLDDALHTYFGRGRGGYGLRPEASLALAVAVAISARALPGLLPAAAWALLGTALFAHALAHATLFLLHLPQRYVAYALPIFLAIWGTALATRLFRRAAARWPVLVRTRVLAGAAAAFLLLDGVPAALATHETMTTPTYLARDYAMDFLATLPKDARIAAHPEDANAIPLVTKRSVLASKEVALPYYRGYYARVAERLEAELRAHYALDWETVDRLYDRYGADVILVHDHRYQPGAPRRFDEPFASRLGEQLTRDRSEYVLVRPPSERLLFHHGPFWVVRLGPPREGYPPREGPNPLIESAPAAAGTR